MNVVFERFVRSGQVVWTVEHKGHVAGRSAHEGCHRPLGNLDGTRAPLQDCPYVVDLPVGVGEAGEELLNVKQFRGELENVVVRAFELLAEFIEERSVAPPVEALDEQLVELLEVGKRPESALGREQTVEADQCGLPDALHPDELVIGESD